MGIFNDADHHPFHPRESEAVVEDARGGLSVESWRDKDGVHEYVRPNERQRGLYIRDESLN